MNLVFRSSKILILSCLTLSLSALAHEKVWPEKRLRQVWPEAKTFTSRQVTLNADQMSSVTSGGVKIASEDRSPTFYFAQDGSATAKNLGVILFVDAYGANGKMEVSVAMDTDGRVRKTDIWSHSENAAVAQDQFLDQFVGKSIKNTFKAGADYKPVSDAVKASEAIASGVQKALLITNAVFKKK